MVPNASDWEETLGNLQEAVLVLDRENLECCNLAEYPWFMAVMGVIEVESRYQMRRKTPCFSYGDIRRSPSGEMLG